MLPQAADPNTLAAVQRCVYRLVTDAERWVRDTTVIDSDPIENSGSYPQLNRDEISTIFVSDMRKSEDG